MKYITMRAAYREEQKRTANECAGPMGTVLQKLGEK